MLVSVSLIDWFLREKLSGLLTNWYQSTIPAADGGYQNGSKSRHVRKGGSGD